MKLSEVVAKITLFIVMFNALIGRWIFPNQGFIKYPILIAVACSFLVKKTKSDTIKDGIKYILIVMALVLCNVLYTNEFKYAYDSFIRILVPILTLVFLFDYYSIHKIKWKTIFLFLNIYHFINTIILLIQLSGNGFLMRFDLTSNPLYLDHISGLFGMSGTQNLVMFDVSLLLFNYYFARKYSKKESVVHIYNGAIFLIQSYICLNNDSKSYFLVVFLVLFGVALGELARGQKNVNKLLLLLLVIFIIPLLLFLAYIILPTVREYFDTFLLKTLSQYVSGFGAVSKTMLHDTDERLTVLNRCFMYSNNYWMGMGFGHIALTGTADSIFHFGINTLSSFFYLGGFVFTITYVFCTLKINKSLFQSGCKKRFYNYYRVYVIAETVLMLYIGQCYIEVSQIVFLAATNIIFIKMYGEIADGKTKEKNIVCRT